MADTGVRRIVWRNADAARVLALGAFFLFLWRFFWLVHHALFLLRRAQGLPAPSFDALRVQLRQRAA